MLTEGIQPEQQPERPTGQSEVTRPGTSRRDNNLSPTVKRAGLPESSFKDRISFIVGIKKGEKLEKETHAKEQNKIPELLNADLERLKDIEILESEIRELKKRPNYPLRFAQIFFEELVKPSEPVEPTLTDPCGNFSYDLSKMFPTIKEDSGNSSVPEGDTVKLNEQERPEEKQKLVDYEKVVVKGRFYKSIYAKEGLQLERGLIELDEWETDPGLVEVKDRPEVKEIIDTLRRKVQATEAVLVEDGQHTVVAKAHDNARAAQQSKDKQ